MAVDLVEQQAHAQHTRLRARHTHFHDRGALLDDELIAIPQAAILEAQRTGVAAGFAQHTGHVDLGRIVVKGARAWAERHLHGVAIWPDQWRKGRL